MLPKTRRNQNPEQIGDASGKHVVEQIAYGKANDHESDCEHQGIGLGLQRLADGHQEVVFLSCLLKFPKHADGKVTVLVQFGKKEELPPGGRPPKGERKREQGLWLSEV